MHFLQAIVRSATVRNSKSCGHGVRQTLSFVFLHRYRSWFAAQAMWKVEEHKGSWRAHLQSWTNGAVTNVRGPRRSCRSACEADVAFLTTLTVGEKTIAVARAAVTQLLARPSGSSLECDSIVSNGEDISTEPRSQRVEVERLAKAAGDAMSAGREEEALEIIDEFLDHRAPLDECWLGANTLLSFAVWKGCASMVSLLLDQHANPNTARADGAFPLHIAAGTGNVQLMHELITWGANPSPHNSAGFTPLQQALRLAPPDVVKDCREMLLLAGHRETVDDQRAWIRRCAADAAEAEWRARARCEDAPAPEEGWPAIM
jgi:hypothetical protein